MNCLPSIISDNKSRISGNTQTLSHSASNLLRRSFARLPFATSNQSGNNISTQMMSTSYRDGNRQQDENLGVDDRIEHPRLATRGGLLQVSNINLNL